MNTGEAIKYIGLAMLALAFTLGNKYGLFTSAEARAELLTQITVLLNEYRT